MRLPALFFFKKIELWMINSPVKRLQVRRLRTHLFEKLSMEIPVQLVSIVPGRRRGHVAQMLGKLPRYTWGDKAPGISPSDKEEGKAGDESKHSFSYFHNAAFSEIPPLFHLRSLPPLTGPCKSYSLSGIESHLHPNTWFIGKVWWLRSDLVADCVT